MDHIELERVSDSSTPRTPPKQITNKNNGAGVSRVPSSSLNRELYQSQFRQRPFGQLRDNLYAALPVPPHVIPVVSSSMQVDQYEAMMVQPSRIADNLTIQDLMEPFSFAQGPTDKDKLAKTLFLKKLIAKLTSNGINYDMAIICNCKASQKYVYETLSSYKYNVRRITDFNNSQSIFGVMVKIRRHIKDPALYTPIERNELDGLFIYDAACHTSIDKELKVFTGVRSCGPTLFNLCCMDSAEIRIFTYNQIVAPEKAITWDTKVRDLDKNLKQILLLQPNRDPDPVFYSGWNDYLSQNVFNWISNPNNNVYQVKFPSKGGLLSQLQQFIVHHPLTTSSIPAHIQHPALPSVATASTPVSPAPTPTSSSSSSGSNGNSSSYRGGGNTSSHMEIDSRPTKRANIEPTAKQQLISRTTSNQKSNSNLVTTKASIIRPDQMPETGIHPDRIAMMINTGTNNTDMMAQTNKRGLSPPKNLPPLSKHRRLDPESHAMKEQASSSANPVRTPLYHPPSSSVDRLSQPASSSSAMDTTTSSPSEKLKTILPPVEEVNAIAAEITNDFDDFLKKALQKFKDDINAIKF
ncbi:uncharacterized protein EV154DRAFT_509997 [Mucor mucedo]|uniref:uncharacterized protein n=1 Tax=Mucor mucedo TaxID=29922 RepID=UPI00221F4DF5|nr:uncharacterized protein EV154DRAFT_509997 [Mucor mucedo]KAI7890922.1 hypothetical protein EV154DRAFT_509997 [Mucor mucedo]